MKDGACSRLRVFSGRGIVLGRLPITFVLVWLCALSLASGDGQCAEPQNARDTRPSFLLAIADDWGWPHAGAYGDAAVKTPAFDRIAREGILFHHAYVSAPSCTPSRGAILTGQWHWRLEGAANLWSVFPDRLRTYPEILDSAGYAVGHTGKAWGPGKTATPGRPVAGRTYPSFAAFCNSCTSLKLGFTAPFTSDDIALVFDRASLSSLSG